MQHKPLLDFLNRLHPLSGELETALTTELIPISLPKNYVLLEAPRVPEYAYFINSGFAMSYFYAKGKKNVQNFWQSGQVMFLPTSFIEQTPSQEHIQLMADSELLCMTQSSVMKLFNDYPEANILHRKIMNMYLQDVNDRLQDLHTLSAPDRLRKLIEKYSEIEQMVPQEDLASYLGITPQSLSRIKRNSEPN